MILVLNKSYIWTNKAATPIIYKENEEEKFYEVSSDINKSDSEGSRQTCYTVNDLANLSNLQLNKMQWTTKNGYDK